MNPSRARLTDGVIKSFQFLLKRRIRVKIGVMSDRSEMSSNRSEMMSDRSEMMSDRREM